MLDIAISIETNAKGITVIETNHGSRLKAMSWPQDCESQLITFKPSSTTCDVIWPEQLADDIFSALKTLQAAKTLKGRKPNWYRRLMLYAEGAP